jgi:hypothetical protein
MSMLNMNWGASYTGVWARNTHVPVSNPDTRSSINDIELVLTYRNPRPHTKKSSLKYVPGVEHGRSMYDT